MFVAALLNFGAEITHFYQQKAIDKLIVVGLLRGSFMFMADLVRELKITGRSGVYDHFKLWERNDK